MVQCIHESESHSEIDVKVQLITWITPPVGAATLAVTAAPMGGVAVTLSVILPLKCTRVEPVCPTPDLRLLYEACVSNLWLHAHMHIYRFPPAVSLLSKTLNAAAHYMSYHPLR